MVMRTGASRTQGGSASGRWRRCFSILALTLLFLAPGGEGAMAASTALEKMRTCVIGQIALVRERAASGERDPLTQREEQGLREFESTVDSYDPFRLSAFCLALGRERPGGYHLWPSFRLGQQRLTLTDDLERMRGQAQALIDRAIGHVQEQFDGFAPLPVEFYVGRDPTALRRKARNLGFGPEDVEWPDGSWRPLCEAGQDLVGFANWNRIVVCLPDSFEPAEIEDEAFSRELLDLLAHEYFHTVQLQSAGMRSGAPYRLNEELGVPGPAWMLEGVAYYIGHRMNEEPEAIRRRLGKTVADYAYDDRSARCAVLERQQASFETVAGSRAVALLAVMELERLAGSGSFAKFYAEIGLTSDWRAAFGTVYGGAPEEVLDCPTD